MLKKCLIALAIVAFASAPALAHKTWGYGVTTTVEWEWDEHPGPPICVQMKVVMWAELYYEKTNKGKDITCLILKQVPNPDPTKVSNNFEGCINMFLCVNFAGIKVGVQYKPDVDIVTTKDNKGYSISIVEAPNGPSWSGYAEKPTASVDVTAVHLSTNLQKLIICLRAKDVDPQSIEYQGDLEPVDIGEIVTTLTPTIAPPGYTGTNPWKDNEHVDPYVP